jgi:hypothetical protein
MNDEEFNSMEINRPEENFHHKEPTPPPVNSERPDISANLEHVLQVFYENGIVEAFKASRPFAKYFINCVFLDTPEVKMSCKDLMLEVDKILDKKGASHKVIEWVLTFCLEYSYHCVSSDAWIPENTDKAQKGFKELIDSVKEKRNSINSQLLSKGKASPSIVLWDCVELEKISERVLTTLPSPGIKCYMTNLPLKDGEEFYAIDVKMVIFNSESESPSTMNQTVYLSKPKENPLVYKALLELEVQMRRQMVLFMAKRIRDGCSGVPVFKKPGLDALAVKKHVLMEDYVYSLVRDILYLTLQYTRVSTLNPSG